VAGDGSQATLAWKLLGLAEALGSTDDTVGGLRTLLHGLSETVKFDRGLAWVLDPVAAFPIEPPATFNLPLELLEAYVRACETALDPAFPAMRAADKVIARSTDLLDYDDWTQSTIYRTVYAPNDVHYALLCIAAEGPGILGQLSLFRSKASGDFQEADLAVIRHLYPHLVNHLRWYHRRRSDAERRREDRTSPTRPTPEDFTPRELEIARLVMAAADNETIARLLGITPNTVKMHLRNLYEKLGITRRHQLISLFLTTNPHFVTGSRPTDPSMTGSLPTGPLSDPRRVKRTQRTGRRHSVSRMPDRQPACSGSRREDPAALAASVKAEARRLGFDLVGVVRAEDMDRFAGIDVSYWEIRGPTVRPADIMPECRSVIVVGWRLWDPALDVAAFDPKRRRWRYPAYALMEARSEKLVTWLLRKGFRAEAGQAGLSLKNLAVLGGLGAYGKNSLVLNPEFGSNFRIGAVLTDASLKPDKAVAFDPCGDCSACLDACPMEALRPHEVDPEACLVSLTLRVRGGDIREVDPKTLERFRAVDIRSFEPRFGSQVHLMCRTCQDACPMNG